LVTSIRKVRYMPIRYDYESSVLQNMRLPIICMHQSQKSWFCYQNTNQKHFLDCVDDQMKAILSVFI